MVNLPRRRVIYESPKGRLWEIRDELPVTRDEFDRVYRLISRCVLIAAQEEVDLRELILCLEEILI